VLEAAQPGTDSSLAALCRRSVDAVCADDLESLRVGGVEGGAAGWAEKGDASLMVTAVAQRVLQVNPAVPQPHSPSLPPSWWLACTRSQATPLHPASLPLTPSLSPSASLPLLSWWLACTRPAWCTATSSHTTL
jgi:hypothetical protein